MEIKHSLELFFSYEQFYFRCSLSTKCPCYVTLTWWCHDNRAWGTTDLNHSNKTWETLFQLVTLRQPLNLPWDVMVPIRDVKKPQASLWLKPNNGLVLILSKIVKACGLKPLKLTKRKRCQIQMHLDLLTANWNPQLTDMINRIWDANVLLT